MKTNGFPKSKRLVSRKLIDAMFGGGHSHSIAAFPLRAVYCFQEVDASQGIAKVQLLISVPKRKFHHAVDRNHVKRQVREAWRLQGLKTIEPSVPDGKALSVAIVWLGDHHVETATIAARVRFLSKRIAERISAERISQ